MRWSYTCGPARLWLRYLVKPKVGHFWLFVRKTLFLAAAFVWPASTSIGAESWTVLSHNMMSLPSGAQTFSIGWGRWFRLGLFRCACALVLVHKQQSRESDRPSSVPGWTRWRVVMSTSMVGTWPMLSQAVGLTGLSWWGALTFCKLSRFLYVLNSPCHHSV